MNKIIWIVLISLGALSPLFGDELDTIIEHSLKHSQQGRNLDNSVKKAELQRQAQYLTLVPNLRVNGDWSAGTYGSINYGISLSESFSHVDSIIQSLRMAEQTRQAGLIQAELDRRDFIDNLITSYVNLCLARKKIEISRADIANQKVLYNIMKVRSDNGREIQLNVDKQQNEIVLSEADLAIEQVNIDNNLRTFLEYSGDTAASFELKGEFGPAREDSQYQLLMHKTSIELTNNSINMGLKKREQWLPRLDLSFSWNYDADANSSGYNLGAGLSFSALDFWERNNGIKQLDISRDSLLLTLSNTYIRWQNDKDLVQKRVSTLELKIQALEKEVALDTKLQDLYKYQYETDQIDYHEYRRRQNTLLTSELNLLQLQGDLFILKKRLQYGIIKP